MRNLAGEISTLMSPNSPAYNILYFLLVVGFTYFYTMVVFQQQKIPENLQRQGAFIPGVRPGKNTAIYLTKVLNRITLVGNVRRRRSRAPLRDLPRLARNRDALRTQ